jgi:hypothetical protein
MRIASINSSYLPVSAVGLVPIALTYGIVPTKTLPYLFDFTVIDRDLIHIFRSVMGLYLACAIFWIVGAIVPRLTRIAILFEVLFMGGLAAGRFLGLLIDGLPSIMLIVYLIAEIVLAAFGIALLRKPSNVAV